MTAIEWATRRGQAFGQRCQAWALRGEMQGLRALGPVAASNLGGWLARTVGPRLAVSRVADANLRQALPELDAGSRAQVIRTVWDNLGRTAAELPHLAGLHRTEAGPGWEIEGEAHLEALAQAGGPVLFFSGHFGNWEMILPIASALGLTVSGAYRAASNPYADAAIQAMRMAWMPDPGGNAGGHGVSMFAKGAQGARQALAHLRAGGSLGLLVDQKMNDGLPVPFFGRPAMTAPALAQFALRFGLPIVPVRVVRLGPARVRMVCEAPLSVPTTGDRGADTQAILVAVNARLEQWIRADPAAWLWLHRRWPKQSNSGLPADAPPG